MILSYVSPDGSSLEFSRDSTQYKLLKNYQGFSDPTMRFMEVSGATQHGSTLLDAHLDAKEMSFDIMIIAADLTALQANIAALIQALNPLRGEGHLFLTYEDGSQYYRKCINAGGPKLDMAGASQTHVKATIVLKASDPFWYGPTTAYPLTGGATAWIPWFAGDWEIGGFGGTVTITNPGDQSLPFVLRIYGGTGSITNPKFTNNATGEYIKIVKKIDTGEWFEINTDENILSVLSYDSSGVETNGYPYLDPATVFWTLPAGGNSFTFSCDTAVGGGYAILTKTDKYVGR